MQSQGSNARSLELLMLVKTPTNKLAVVVEAHEGNEYTIQWFDGDRARFKVCHLRPVEKL